MTDASSNAPAAGPGDAGDPPPPPVAEASSGVGPPTTPPADESTAKDIQGSDDPADDAQGTAAEVETDLDKLLEDTKRERDEYLELAQRTKADFENYRKRMAAEVQAAAGRGRSEVIREVVPVLDDLERALAAAGIEPAAEATPDEPLAQGVLLVFRSLRDTLARNGIEPVDPRGERFDPQWHEALSTQPADGAEPGTVLEVVQKGYRLGDQLIRPARVVVSE